MTSLEQRWEWKSIISCACGCTAMRKGCPPLPGVPLYGMQGTIWCSSSLLSSRLAGGLICTAALQAVGALEGPCKGQQNSSALEGCNAS